MSVGAADLVPGQPVRRQGLEYLEAGGEIAARSPLQLFWRRFRRDRVAIVSLAFIVFLIIVAFAAPLIVKAARAARAVRRRTPTSRTPSAARSGPSSAHPFGVDQLGQDVMSRVIYGTRVSLVVGIVGTGDRDGHRRRPRRASRASSAAGRTPLLSRFVDVVLSIPILLLGLGIGAACAVRGCLGGTIQPGVAEIIFLIALVNWTYIFRIVRGLVLSLREREFVDASRALGASNARIMFREILPNLVAPIIVYSTLLIPLNILLEASLSFLGVGIRPPTASWGQMIAAATPIFNTAWWYMAFPGLALLLTVLAFNLLGDGLQDALNPKTAR